VLLVDCYVVIETMVEDGAIDGMVITLGLLDDCSVVSGLLEESNVERYLSMPRCNINIDSTIETIAWVIHIYKLVDLNKIKKYSSNQTLETIKFHIIYT
jgi:hypothetical protein